MTYHNTVPLQGETLNQKRVSAKTQDQRVLEWWQKYPNEYSPGDVYLYSEVFDTTKPQQLNSARRACTNLMNAGELTRTTKRIKCPVTGEVVGCYRLVKTQGELF